MKMIKLRKRRFMKKKKFIKPRILGFMKTIHLLFFKKSYQIKMLSKAFKTRLRAFWKPFWRIRLDWIGLDWIRLDQIGLDWIGLDQIGLDWIGLD